MERTLFVEKALLFAAAVLLAVLVGAKIEASLSGRKEASQTCAAKEGVLLQMRNGRDVCVKKDVFIN